MTSIFFKDMSVYSAKQWRNSLSGPDAANVYLTFGKTTPWDDENAPPQAESSVIDYYHTWNNMIGGKKISTNDVRHVIPRFDWASGTVYFQYDDTVDASVLKSQNTALYVITDEWNVYKCLSNNYGAQSTSKPTSISTVTDVQTEDGYIWKYMYTVSAEEQLRWTTDDYIPVKELTVNDGSLQWGVQNNAINGAIHNILLINHGTGYIANDIIVTITGDGQDAAAIAVRNTTTYQIDSIVVTDKGIGYSYANVSISSATGSSATARAIISPYGGHGFCPLNELGGSNLMINARISTTENGVLSANNDYRQVALLEKPLTFGSSNEITATAVNQLITLTLNGTSANYILDEVVYQGSSLATATFSGVVVEWISASNILKLSNVTGTPSSDLVKGVQSAAARFVSSVTNPDMETYTGNILYLNNIEAVERSMDQLEDYKIVLVF